MLLAYGHSIDIPKKLNVFYSQAYEALFQHHDALKNAFQRERKTNLDIQDFAEILNCFSTLSYDKRDFVFSRITALSYLRNAKKISNIEFIEENFLDDALKSVCILVEDGLSLTFSHRSFQEYFTAKFIVNSSEEVQQKLLNKYSKYIYSDSVIELIHEIDSHIIEKFLIVPTIERLEKEINYKGNVGITHYLKYLKLVIELVEIEDDEVIFLINLNNHTFNSILTFIIRNYMDKINSNFESIYLNRNNLIIEKYGEKGKAVLFKIPKLTTNDDIIKDLAYSGGFFSIQFIQDLIKIKKAIIQSQKKLDSSIEQILNI